MIEPALPKQADENPLFFSKRSVLELPHLLSEDPQRPVEAHSPVDARHLARTDAPALRAAAGLAAAQGVLLDLCFAHRYVQLSFWRPMVCRSGAQSLNIFRAAEASPRAVV